MIRLTSAEEALPAARQLIDEVARLTDRLYTPSVQELRDDLGKLDTDSLTDTFSIEVAVKGQLTPEARARAAAFLTPEIDADTLLTPAATPHTVPMPGGRQLRLQVYAAEDPPVRKALQLQAPVLFFVGTDAALADQDTPDDLADLCEQRPYVALLVPTEHAAAEALLATAKRHAWYATAIDLATVPPQGLDQLLASPAWVSVAPLMQAHAITTALATQLTAGRDGLATRSQTVQAALAQATQHTVEGQQRLTAALETMHTHVEALRSRLTAAQTAADEQVAALTQAVTATQQEVTDQVQTAGGHLTALHGELGVALGRLQADFLTPETERLLDETQTRIERELRDLVDHALEQVTDTLRDTSRKLTEASDDAARERQLVEPLIRQLEPLIGPLRQVTDHVMDVARGLGLG